jgi:peptidoglycan/LPS O-acetylase OafA/YrhL
MREIKPLTTLRGVFALWVMSFHLALSSPVAGFGGWTARRGYFGVEFFFVLSGFVLASAHSRAFMTAFHWRDYFRFVWLRIGRLYPLHLAVIICVMACWTLIYPGPRPTWIEFLAEAGLAQRWLFSGERYIPVNGPSWSISTEWTTNLFFPVLVALILRARRLWPLTFAASCGTVIWAAAENHWELDMGGTNIPWPLLRSAGEFALGMFAYRFRQRFQALGTDAALLVQMAMGIVLLRVNHSDLVIVILMFTLVLGLSQNEGLVSKSLSYGPLHWLGTISFSIYLVQLPVIVVMRKLALAAPSQRLELIIFSGGSLAVTILVAALTHYGLEVPARDWSKRILKRQRIGKEDGSFGKGNTARS